MLNDDISSHLVYLNLLLTKSGMNVNAPCSSGQITMHKKQLVKHCKYINNI